MTELKQGDPVTLTGTIINTYDNATARIQLTPSGRCFDVDQADLIPVSQADLVPSGALPEPPPAPAPAAVEPVIAESQAAA